MAPKFSLSLSLSLLLGLSLLAACGGKDDDDTGGDDVDEGALDPDEDGLTNDEEAALGTDPDNADTDGDGVNDGDEIDAGTNPTYEYSHTYAGGYNVGYCESPFEDDATGATGIGSQTIDGTLYEWTAYQLGDVVENFTLLDQHGEQVDFYSFCGKHIVFAVGAGWCGPCRGVAEGLQAEQDLWRDSNVQFIEIISQDDYGNAPDQAFLEQWHSDYGFTDIPVLALAERDQSSEEAFWAHLSSLFDRDMYIPSIWQVDASGVVVSADEANSDPTSFVE